MVQQNYLQIKQDVQDIIQSEIERLLNDPEMGYSRLLFKLLVQLPDAGDF
jgi:hypothetical protein